MLLFTTAGYRALVNLLEKQAQENMQAVIEEKTYDPAHLIELSVRLDLPYLSDWHNWEAVEGMVTIEGVPYQYVERILKDGKMIYRCLPNDGMQQAISARDRFMQFSYDLTHPGGQKSPSHPGSSIKPPLPDLFSIELLSLNHPDAAGLLKQPFQFLSAYIINAGPSVPTPPPDCI